MSTKYQNLMSQYQESRAVIAGRYTKWLGIEDAAAKQRRSQIEQMRDEELQVLDAEYGLTTQVIAEAPLNSSAIAPPNE